MIQFNLLPDVKLEYVRARRSKRMMVLLSAGISGLVLFVLIVLVLVVVVFQKKHLNDLNSDIKKYTGQLQAVPDLNKILTVQNQLNNLPQLHGQKPVVTRLPGYISQITPNQVSISKLDVDFTQQTINMAGAADSISTVNTFVDTIKFTTYSVGSDTTQKPAFSNVVLASFGKDDKGTSYQITLKYDPAIFDSKSDIKLTVPNQITTRSQTEKPTDLFQPNSNTKQ